MKMKIHFNLKNLRENEYRDEFHMTHTLTVMCGMTIGLELLCVEMDIQLLCWTIFFIQRKLRSIIAVDFSGWNTCVRCARKFQQTI